MSVIALFKSSMPYTMSFSLQEPWSSSVEGGTLVIIQKSCQ